MADSHGAGTSVVPTLAVGDVRAAIDWYRDVLGFAEEWAWGEPPTHASVHLDGVQIHLSALAPDPGANWLYFSIPDVDGLYEALTAAGVESKHPPEDQEWGMREIAITDLAGNHLTFGSPTIVREPKIAIEREDVPLRLERRLAALVRELAEHKGVTLDEFFEETLLHTFEEVEAGGVASPHTSSDLRLIVKLREEHGIDYDCHASYRFAESSPDGDEATTEE